MSAAPVRIGEPAVEVELEIHDGVGLAAPVHRLRRAGHVMRARDAEPVAARQLAVTRLPSRRLLDPVEAGRNAVRVHLQIVDGAIRRCDQVRASHVDRIEAELVRHAVQQRLEGMARVHGAVPAHRAAGRRVGVHAIAVVAHRIEAIERVQQRAGVEDRDEAVPAVRAAALHDLAVHGGDLARALHPELQPDVRLGAAAVGEEAVLAGLLHAHGAARRARQGGGHDLEIERLDAVPEAATHEGLHDAHLRAVDAEALRDGEMQVVRHLRHGVRREAILLGLVLHDGGIALDLAVRDLGVVEGLLAHEIGRGETAVDVAEVLAHLALDVAGLLLVQRHGIGRARIGSAEVRRQGLEVEHDRLPMPLPPWSRPRPRRRPAARRGNAPCRARAATRSGRWE